MLILTQMAEAAATALEMSAPSISLTSVNRLPLPLISSPAFTREAP